MQVKIVPVFYNEADMTWCDSKISYRHHSLLSSVINWVETLFLGALRYGSIRGNGFSFTFDCAALIYVLYSAENGRPLQHCVVTQKKMPHHHLISCWNGLPSDTKHRQGRQSMNDFGGDWHRKNVCDGNEILFEMTLFSWWECRIQNTNKLTSSDLCVIFASVSIFTGSLIAHSIWCLLYYWRTWIYLRRTGCNICILYLYSS